MSDSPTDARRRLWAAGVIVPVALLLLSLPICVTALSRQLALMRFERLVSGYEAGAADPARVRAAVRNVARCDADCPADSMLLAAIAGSDLAAREPQDAVRRRDLATAHAMVARALAERPGWGAALAVAAAVDAQAGQRRAAIDGLRRSYAAAPYLRAQAPWRLHFAASVWPDLDETIRADVIAEALWMTRIGYRDGILATASLGDTPAGVRFALASRPPDDAAGEPAP